MILVDANLLLYAHQPSLPQHARAKAWLEDRLNESSVVGLPWPSLLAFARIASNPRAFRPSVSVEEAWNRVEAWLDLPNVRVPLPTDRHREVLRPLLAATQGRSNLVPDAHLAALAIEHGLLLCSTDGDFARFPGLRWENPIVEPGTARR